MDEYVGSLYTNAGITDSSLGVVGTSVQVTSATVESYFTLAYQLMSEANVPKQGRWASVPPWVIKLVNQAMINDMTENTTEIRNGFVGRAYGFDFYESNNLTNDGTDWNIAMGREPAITVAQQIVEVEAMRDQDSFSDLIRGLHVYGAKVVRPDQLVLGVVKK